MKISHFLPVGAALLLAACQAKPEAAAEPTAPAGEVWMTEAQVAHAGVRLTAVQKQQVAAPVLTSGRLAFDDAKVGHVVPPITGRVVSILASLGQHVQPGAPLATISSPDLAEVVADASRAHSDLLARQREYERLKTLYEGHAAAQRDFEAAHNHYLQAQAEYRRAGKKSRLLGGDENSVTDTYVLRAPVEGDVVARNINPGGEVQGQYDGGSSVAELFTIGSLESVWALAEVFEMDLTRVDLGDEAQVSVVAYPGEIFHCKLDYVAPTINPATRSAQVRCRLDNLDHRLKPEMFISMKILSDRGCALLAPRRSLFRYGGQTVVFVASPKAAPGGKKRFIRRTVIAQDEAYGDAVPIHAGLEPGEVVVAAGGIMLLES